MKKTSISVFIIIFILTGLLSACEKEVHTKEFFPERAFSVHMTATKGEKSFEADIICRTYEDIEIAFTKPKELSGFSVKTTENGYNINVFGVPDEIPDTQIEDTSLLNILTRTIKTAIFTNHGCFTEKEDCFEAELIIDGTSVTVSFTKDGYLRDMNAPEIGFSAIFEYSG